MTAIQVFCAGVSEGFRPFRAAWRPLLIGSGMMAVAFLMGAVLDLAGWPTLAVAIIAAGSVSGGGLLISAWLAMFRAVWRGR